MQSEILSEIQPGMHLTCIMYAPRTCSNPVKRQTEARLYEQYIPAQIPHL